MSDHIHNSLNEATSRPVFLNSVAYGLGFNNRPTHPISPTHMKEESKTHPPFRHAP